MGLLKATRAEGRATKRAAMYDARIQSSQTAREMLGHAMDYVRAALDGCDDETARQVTADLIAIGTRHNGRFDRERKRPSPKPR